MERKLFLNVFLVLSSQVESVDLACKLLDGSDLKGQKVSVEPAQFKMKGNFNPGLKPKKRKKKDKEKIKKMQDK